MEEQENKPVDWYKIEWNDKRQATFTPHFVKVTPKEEIERINKVIKNE